jgi:hypothetical protein
LVLDGVRIVDRTLGPPVLPHKLPDGMMKRVGGAVLRRGQLDRDRYPLV